MIELQDVSKTYAKSEHKAVDSLSLTVPDGRIFGFLGPNGAGKTTTIRVLCGALNPDEGTALIDGISMRDSPLEAKRRIGLVHDNPELFNRLKAHEFLDFVADVFGVPTEERRLRIEEYAARFSLSDALASSIGSMSRGMKQKLCVMASLIHDPHNWVLDEPMVGLDPQAAFELKEIMRERTKAGKCVFFSTHVMEVAEKVCDELAIINKGSIIFEGNLAELRSKKSSAPSGTDESGTGESGDSLESLFLNLVDSSNGEPAL
ncbi:MAG TPA: ABC transporter ATP-binding protein [Rectinemataceae bacterium]|nr:ABC transporter ATP-binding protein [Rectinemataceae bacterium]